MAPLGGENWLGKYAGRYFDADAGKRVCPEAAGSDLPTLAGVSAEPAE